MKLVYLTLPFENLAIIEEAKEIENISERDQAYEEYGKLVVKKFSNTFANDLSKMGFIKYSFDKIDLKASEVLTVAEIDYDKFVNFFNVALKNTEYVKYLEMYLEDRFTSYDGFASLYSTDVKEWQNYLHRLRVSQDNENVIIDTFVETYLKNEYEEEAYVFVEQANTEAFDLGIFDYED